MCYLKRYFLVAILGLHGKRHRRAESLYIHFNG